MAQESDSSATLPTAKTRPMDASTMPVKQINGTNGINGNGGPISNGVNGTNDVHKPVQAFDLPLTQSGIMHKKEPQHETKKNERTYAVSDPVRPSTFEQYHEPLPFPDSLKGVVCWTDAFIDRIAYLVEQHETEDKKKEKTIGELNRQLDDSRRQHEHAEQAAEHWRKKHGKIVAQKRTLEFENKSLEDQSRTKDMELHNIQAKLKQEQREHTAATGILNTYKKMYEQCKKKYGEKTKELKKFKKEDEVEDEAFRNEIKKLEAQLEKEKATHAADHDLIAQGGRHITEEMAAKQKALAERDGERKKVGELEKHVYELEKQVHELKGSKEDLEKKLEEALADKTSLQVQVNHMDGQNAKLKSDIEVKNNQIKDLESRLKSKADALISVTMQFEDLSHAHEKLVAASKFSQHDTDTVFEKIAHLISGRKL